MPGSLEGGMNYVTADHPALDDVRQPLIVDSAESVDWQDVADVVVIGFGSAGAAAALEARELGGDVLIIDRFEGGGATALSGGVCYAAGTSHQRAAGVQDDAGEMYKYMRLEASETVSDETLRRFCDESNGNLEWLERHGVPFSGEAFLEKTAMPPEGKFLYYSGNEKAPRYAGEARPAPRGHRTVGKGMWTGRVFFDALRRAVEKSGIRQLYHAPGNGLVVDRGGRVIGVVVNIMPDASKSRHQSLHDKVSPVAPFTSARWERTIGQSLELEGRESRPVLIRARRGVVLATGGYEYNLPMLRHYLPSSAAHFRALLRAGSLGSDGSGVRLGQSVGAATRLMDSKLISSFIGPPDTLLRGIMVNRQGRRFINEDSYVGFLGNAINDQKDCAAWLIVDSRTFWKTVRETLTPNGDGQFMSFKLPQLLNILFGGTKHSRSIEGLARKCGIDPAELERTIASYNAAARTGAEPFGKNAKYLQAIGRGPFQAINKSTANIFCFGMFMTLGGLDLDERSGAVRRRNGTTIEGLFAAGRTAVGVCSRTYISGLSLADTTFSGRRAGRAIMEAAD